MKFRKLAQVLLVLSTVLSTSSVCLSYHVFTFSNHCPLPIWLALSGNAGSEHFKLKDLKLEPLHGTGMPFPNGWTGQIWAKTHCNETGHCLTGDCGPDDDCQKSSPKSAATVAYFALDSLYKRDYYQISLVNGFNLPIQVEPLNPPNQTFDAIGEHCMPTGCRQDLNGHCPEQLALRDEHNQTVACRSACHVFGTDQYCCTGSYSKESACQSSTWPTDYAKLFHEACLGSQTYSRDSSSPALYCDSHSVRFNINFCTK